MALLPYNDVFATFLQALNPEQRRAVDTIEGPVMVVAGPGTGKTHLMAARVGKILMETDTPPQSILCLTFTDAAVSALRARLLQMIGPEAYRVTIATFHSFCHRIIQDNPDYFGFAELSAITDLERIEIIRQLLASLSPDHPLRHGYKDPFFYEKHLSNLFTLMKRENWTPGWVRRCADRFIKGLANNPDFIYQRNTATARKGDLKKAQIEAATDRMERLKAAVDLYPEYLHALERARRYEFEDMILWVLRAFEKNEALLRTYQERYLYVQVDEFQDTNGAQYDLLKQMLDYWQTPNVLIVGDDDQSIYEFQGARLEHLRDFQKRYEQGLTTVVLRRNYRSAQNILDTAANLIRYNTLRATDSNGLPFDKHLIAQSALPGVVVIHRYDTSMAEISDVADHIEAFIQQGVAPQEIAVIYAQHRQADALQTLLARRQIPHQAKRPTDVLSLPIIEQLCNLLYYLADEAESPHHGQHRLFRLLHAPFWQLHPADLVNVAVALRLQGESGNPLPWRTMLTSAEYVQKLSLRRPEAFEHLAANLDHWIAAVYREPLPQLLEQLYTQTGLLAWAANQADKWTTLQALKTFLDFATAETLRRQERSATMVEESVPLRHFLQLLESMRANRLPLPLQQPIQAGPAVQLLTAHAAKGLEFEYVFLIDCVEDFWEKKSGKGRQNFAFPPDLQPSAEADLEEAQRRLFYVAITRAKRALYISYAQRADDGKPRIASRFIAETKALVTDREMKAQSQLENLKKLLQQQSSPSLRLPEDNAWEQILANFQMSITALNRYLRCPRAFYIEDFLKIPAATSEAAAFGLAMHRTLQRFAAQEEEEHKRRSYEALQLLFKAEMERWRSHFKPAHFQQRLSMGLQVLQALWEDHWPTWPRRVVTERRIDRVRLGDLPLTGVIDRIEWLGNGTIRLVDFKTEMPDLSKAAPPSEAQPYGGEYWRQMAFYCLLLENSRSFAEPVRETVIQWLHFDRQKKLPRVSISLTRQDLLFTENLIAEVWHRIQQKDFNPGCQQSDCPWCKLYEHQPISISHFPREADLNLDDPA